MSPLENRVTTLFENLSLRDREIVEGATSTLLGTVKVNGSLGLLAMILALQTMKEDLEGAVVRSEIGDAVLALCSPEVVS